MERTNSLNYGSLASYGAMKTMKSNKENDKNRNKIAYICPICGTLEYRYTDMQTYDTFTGYCSLCNNKLVLK